jgi:hypothetical protein
MLGMNLASFVVLSIISAVSALIVHNVLKLGMPGSGEGYLSQLKFRPLITERPSRP